MMTSASKYVASALIVLGFLACAEANSGAGLALPLIVRGTSPEANTGPVRIERVPAGVEIGALLERYQVTDAASRRISVDLDGSPGWWVVIPPIQRTGGYQLQVRIEPDIAYACLQPPDGLASMALTSSAFLIALPNNVGTVRWEGACA